MKGRDARTVGRAIAILRAAKGLAPHEVCDRAAISTETLRRFERGRVVIGDDLDAILFALSDFLPDAAVGPMDTVELFLSTFTAALERGSETDGLAEACVLADEYGDWLMDNGAGHLAGSWGIPF